MPTRQLAATVLLVLTVALAAAALAPTAAAVAGSGIVAPITIIEDPAGDQVVSSTLPEALRPSYGQIDITKVTLAENAGNVIFTVTTSAAPTATSKVVLHFGLDKGNLSLPESTASGKDYSISGGASGGSGVDNVTTEVAGNDLIIKIPRTSLEATGGDIITDITVEGNDADAGPTATPLDDSTGHDGAPDSGSAGPYALDRVPPHAELTWTALGGTVQNNDGTKETFSGTTVTVQDASADIVFNFRLTNVGTDAEDVDIAAAGNIASPSRELVSRADASLLPNQAVNVTYTLRLANAEGTVNGKLSAIGHRGSSADITTTVTIPTVVTKTDGPRENAVPGLDFLTPAAEATGFDDAFGDYAELAFLLACLLLLIILLFLLLFLRKGPWVKIRISPKHAVVAPGGTARFEVRMAGKGADRLARTTVGGGDWRAGLAVGNQQASQNRPADLQAPRGGTEGVLEVHVPGTAEPKARQTLEIEAVPLEDGEAVPKRRGRAKVTVQAGVPSHADDDHDLEVHLTNIQHDPARPVPGSTVTTTATLQNDGASAASMRVVLMLDGKAVREENVEIPPASSRSVRLPWTASAGPTRVKVQAFLA